MADFSDINPKLLADALDAITSTLTDFDAALSQQSISADGYLKANNLTGIKKLLPAIKAKDYYLVISHAFYAREPALVEQLWNRIGILREGMIESNAPDYLSPTE